jgi:hypothetical protein
LKTARTKTKPNIGENTMISLKTTLSSATAALLLFSGLAMANAAPKATIEINSETKNLVGTLANNNSARDLTWHYGEVNDDVIFSSNISIANRSHDIVYSTIEFRNMNIIDEAFILPGKSVDNITTNFPFRSVHVILSDSYHRVFFDGNIYANSHFTITPVDTYVNFGIKAGSEKAQLKLVRS